MGTAPAPPPLIAVPAVVPRSTLIPEIHLAQFLAAANPIIASWADSLGTPAGGNSVEPSELSWSIIRRTFQKKYPSKFPNPASQFLNFAIGGTTEGQFLATGTSIAPNPQPAWFTNLANTPASYIKAAAPDLLIMSDGMNGGNAFNNMKANLAQILTWPKIPSILYITNKQGTQNPASGLPTTLAQWLTSASVWRSAIATNAPKNWWGMPTCPYLGIIDVGRFSCMAIEGFDPVNQYLQATIGSLNGGSAIGPGSPITGITSFPYYCPASPGGDFALDVTFPGQAAAFSAGTGLGIIQIFLDGQSTVLHIQPSGGNVLCKLFTANGTGSTGSYFGGAISASPDLQVQLWCKEDAITLVVNGVMVLDTFMYPRCQTPGFQPQITPTITSGASLNLNAYAIGVPQPTIPLLSDPNAFPIAGGGPLGGGTGKHGTSNWTSLLDYQVIDQAIVAGGYGITPGLPPTTVTVGASPYAYTATTKGRVVTSGGTVSAITLTRGSAGAINMGVTAGSVAVDAGDIVTVTYSAAPTINFIPGT